MSERAETSATDFWEDADEAEALQRYRTLVNTIDDGIYQLDADGRIVAVNDVIVELSGYSREELLGEHVSALLDAEDVATIEREIERRLGGGDDSHATLEFEARTADGGSFPCELRLNLLTDDGRLRGTIGVIRDVSDRKQAERELDQRERELERERDLTDELLEASPMGVMVLDAEGEITQINERATELLGIPETGLQAYSPGDRPTYDEEGRPVAVDDHPFAEVLETGEPVYDRVLQVERPNGERRWLSVNAAPVLTDDGEIHRVITTGEDVTDIKERERKLEDELSEVFGRVTDAFYALDVDWNFTHANDRAEELVDYRGEGLVGKNFWDVFEWAEGSTLGDEYREAMATQEPTSFEFYYPDPLEAWYEVHAYPSETGLSVYFRDVTERKEREHALREREEELSRLMENVPGMVYRCRNERGWPMEFVSDACGDLTGHDPEALERGEVVWGEDVVVSADRERVWDELRSAVTDREPFSVTYRIETAEGDLRWVRDHGRGVFDDEGELVRLEGIISDITDQKERERELEEYRSRYQTLIEHFPNGAVALVDEDGDGNLRYVTFGGTPETEEVTRDELEGSCLREGLPAELADVVVPHYEAALDGESATVEATIDDGVFQFHFLPVRDDDGEVFAALGMSQDVTEREKYQRKLEESERRYRALADYFPNGIVTLFDHDLVYTLAAGKGFEDIPVTPDEVDGKHFREVWGEETADELEPVFEAALDGRQRSVELAYAGREWVVHGVPITDHRGDVFAGMTMAQDITEQKERERRLQRYRQYTGAVLDAIDDVFYIIDAAGELQRWNDTLCEVTDYRNDEVEEMHALEFFDEEDREEIANAMREAFETGSAQVESEVVTRSGDRIPFEFVASALDDPDGERVLAGIGRNVTEQKERERYLRDAKSQLEAATEAGAVGTWEWHIPEDEFVTGASFARTFGVDPEAAREGVSIDRVVSAIHEEDRERVERRIEEAIESCDEYTEEYRVWNADDELRWVVARGHVECDDEGNPVRFPGALTDITERKRAEQKLEAHRRQLETLFEVLPVGVVVAGADGQIVEANEAEKEIWGGDAFDAESTADYDQFNGWWADTGEPIEADEWIMTRVLGGEEVTDPDIYDVEGFDGERRTIMSHGMPIRDETGEVVRGVVTETDITERREYQRQLEESERRYRALAENFPNGGVGVFDRDLQYTLVTGTMWDDIDPDAADLEGEHVRDALPPDTADDVEPLFRAALDGETGSVVSTLGGRTYRVWATPLRDADGEITAGQSFALDITEQVERERKLERTVEKLEESNERLESFASMLAHELRNPVTIGQIYSQQLPAKSDSGSDAVEYVTEAFDRIEDMIDVMLVLTRGREAIGESTPLALADVARDAWEGVETPDATLEIDVTNVVQADETYLRHLFRNLFENSVQHGDGDGDVTVRIGDLPSGFYVEDDGVGIPTDDRNAVFEAGFTTAADSGGTGLGLAFVKELAEVYGWTCTATESDSGGARFEFRSVDSVDAA